jgi:pimeloyl-ACP methyl ester carboxylesterase
MANDQKRMLQPDSSGYVEINNVKLYYEIFGEGTPLLYLHGGLSSSKDFRRCIPELCKDFKVITVDRKGHGRSYDDNEPFSYSLMADSMNSFLEALGIEAAHVIGWSDGGIVGYHLASKYPARVIKLIAIGANYLVNGMTNTPLEWITTQLTAENISKVFPAMEKEYKESSPNPGNFPKYINGTREMWLRDPLIAKDELTKITAPTLLILGDKDDIRFEHMLEIHSLVKTSQLCVLPNTTHFVFVENAEIAVKIFLRFLKEGNNY